MIHTNWIKTLLVGWMTLQLFFAARPSHANERPNVLLIISEDNGPQFGCYGDQNVPTPHIDRLAACGVRFSQAFVTQAVCSPSRASIYTGLYPHQHGQIGLATHLFTTVGEPANLAKLLKAAGYRTGLIGKLHVLPEEDFPFDFRFADPNVVSFAHRDVKRIAEVAGEFMTAAPTPFCLTVSFPDTHLPFIPQDTGLPDRPLDADSPLKMFPEVGIDSQRLREHLANYYNCVQRLDAGVGFVMEQLAKSGKDGNTLVIFVGDHGPQFARGKVTSYEFGLRVPLIVSLPGKIVQNSQRNQLVSTIDLLPTILDVTGSVPPPSLPGQSLLPLIHNEAAPGRKYLFSEWNTSHTGTGPLLYFPQRAVRDARYKLILSVMSGVRNPCEEYYTSQALVQTGPNQSEIDMAAEPLRRAYATWRESPAVELYDLQNDPYELNNLAERSDLDGVKKRLLNELQQWRESTGDPLLDPNKVRLLAAEHIEQHQAVSARGRSAYRPWKYPQYLYGRN